MKKTVLITGATSGIRYEFSKIFMENNYDVILVGRNLEKLIELEDFSKKKYVRAYIYKFDLSLSENIDFLYKKIKTEVGKVDILINNAGIQIRNKWHEFEDEDWQRVIDVNLTAAYHLAHEAALVMAKSGGGKIINIGSMQSYRAGKFIFPYTASKHVVMGLTKAYADALASENIQVNALAPGYIDTPMTKILQEDQERNTEILNHIPAGHWADPSELMGAIVFLASSASNYITGVTLPVDGGYLLR